MAIKERSALNQDTTANYIETISHDDYTAVANFKLLFSFTIAPVASDMSLYMNGFTILLSDIFWDAIELPSFAIFSHNFQHLSFTGVLNIAFNINPNRSLEIYSIPFSNDRH